MKHEPFTVYVGTKWSVCSGVILDEKTILTAAHCLQNVTPGEVEVHAGVQHKDEFYQPLKVQQLIIHPLYDEASLTHDLAIIKLKHRLPFNNRIQRISLYYDDVEEGKDAYVTGWGVNLDGRLSDSIRSLPVNIYPSVACARKYGSDFHKDLQLCAGTQNQDFCIGDSGGPLVINFRNDPYLVGIVSYTGEQCSDGRPSVYTKMKTYRKFIEQNLES